MKNSGTIAALFILIGLGVITVSCEKEKTAPRKAELTIEYAKDGGDDDEDPVIRGKVKKKNSVVVISGATVEILTYGTNIKIGEEYTDSLGNFEDQVPAGIYYFKVTIPGNSIPIVTDSVHVSKDVQVTIEVD